MRKLLLAFLLLIIPTLKVEGYYCNYQDVAKYKKIASNINYSYEYEEINGDVIFHITFVNLNSALYLKDSNSNVYNYTSSELVVNAKSGENLIFYVYPTDRYCDDEYIYSIRIQLPTYNIYHNDPICDDVKNYSLCNKWSTHKLTYEKFVQNVKTYKESLNQKQVIIEKEEKGLYEYIIEYALKYHYIIIIIIVASSSIVIYTRSKKNNIYN